MDKEYTTVPIIKKHHQIGEVCISKKVTPCAAKAVNTFVIHDAKLICTTNTRSYIIPYVDKKNLEQDIYDILDVIESDYSMPLLSLWDRRWSDYDN